MGRTVQVEASIEQYAQQCVQNRLAGEIGILVGRCAPGKDLVLQALPTPPRDNAKALSVTAAIAGKKSVKSGAAPAGLHVDEELVIEHAEMVERSLPGGLDLVGLYLLCPPAAFAASSAMLASLASRLARDLGSSLPSLLIMLMDSVSGTLTLREAAVAGTSGTLRPAELKASQLADQLLLLQSRYEVQLQLPVTNSKQEVQQAFQAAAGAAALRVQGALGLVHGQLADGGRQLADLVAGGNQVAGSGGGSLPVELLLPPPSSLSLYPAGGSKAGSSLQRGRADESAQGTVTLRGCLDCRACIHPREAAVQAVEALAADVNRSLHARLDVLLDAAEQQQDAAQAEAEASQRQQGGAAAQAPPAAAHPLFTAVANSGKPLHAPLPRRAFVAAAGGIPYCDYLLGGESSQAVLGRLQMLLPMALLTNATVECLEQAPNRPQTGPRMAQGKRGGRVPSSMAGGSAGANVGLLNMPCSKLAAGALVVALIALFLGYMTLGLR